MRLPHSLELFSKIYNLTPHYSKAALEEAFLHNEWQIETIVLNRHVLEIFWLLHNACHVSLPFISKEVKF